MARILAVDYGTKRTGIAVTDPLQIIASPLEMVPTHKLQAFLTSYFKTEDVEKVILGFPKDTFGNDTNVTAAVRAFAKTFEKLFVNIPLILHDERFTSKMAEGAIIMGGVKKKNRQEKGLVDKVSATIILQSYLESVR